MSGRRDDLKEWVADTGASHHPTGSMDGMFNMRAPPRGNENVILGDCTVLPARAVGSLHLIFYMEPTDGAEPISYCVQLTDVYVLGDIKFNFFSLHQTQQKQGITLTRAGVSLFRGQQRFDRNVR